MNKLTTGKEPTFEDPRFPKITEEEKKAFEILRDPEAPIGLMRVYSQALQRPVAALVLFQHLPSHEVQMWPIGMVITQEMFESGDLIAPDYNEYGDLVAKED